MNRRIEIGISAAVLCIASCTFAQVPVQHGGADSSKNVGVIITEQPQPLMDINRAIVYPLEAQKAGLEGHVLLSGLINVEGKLEKIAVWESTDKIFEDAAVNAIRECKFTAAMSNGKAIRSWYNLPIVFQLKDFARYDTPPILSSDFYSILSLPKNIPEDSIPEHIFPVFGVGTDGYVRTVEYFRPGNSDVQQSVREALKKSSFKPALKNGKPVDTWYAMTIDLKRPKHD
jgi:TonB family protein